MYVFNELTRCFLLYKTLCILINTGTCLGLNTYDMERPGKNLCVNESKDCSNQVKSSGNSSASCFMTFLWRNSTECGDSEFKGDVDTTEDLGIVSLNPFPWYTEGIRQPNINITFSKIRWKSLRMRYVEVGSNISTLCRKFEVSEEIDLSSVISFDCSWEGNSSGQKYKFEYILFSKDNRKLLRTYLLQIPTHSDVASDVKIEYFHVFIMLDSTSFPDLSAKIRVPPSRLKISKINVTLNYKEHLSNDSKPLRYVSVNVTNQEAGEFMTVNTYETNGDPGIYYFTANCQSDVTGRHCIESSTPPLEIPVLRADDNKMNIQEILSIALIAVISTVLLAFYILRRKRQNLHKGKPNVLFVYEPTYPCHIDNIYKFKEFIDRNCSINSKLDLIEIPKSKSKSPREWYCKAFEDADYVILFASPKDCTEKGVHEDNVYHNLQIYALKLLVNYMLTKHNFMVASVRLPGCSWKTLPLEVAGLISKSCRFALPEKLDRMCKFMNLPTISNGASAFLTALQQERRRPQITLPRATPPTISPPIDPSDNENMELDLPKWIHIHLDGESSSEEDDDVTEISTSIVGFNL